jgi:hypothetical protein
MPASTVLTADKRTESSAGCCQAITYPQPNTLLVLFLLFLLVSRREFPFKISILTDLREIKTGLKRIFKGSKIDKNGVKVDTNKIISFN